MAREFGVELIEQARDLALGMCLELRHSRCVAVVHPAFRREIDDQARLQRIGQPHQPFVEMRAFCGSGVSCGGIASRFTNASWPMMRAVSA